MDIEQASRYDRMINWNKRLEREIPVITQFLKGKRILDIACASGRHSLALTKLGFSPLGIDISDAFIHIAKELDIEKKGDFIAVDATSKTISDVIDGYFDSAILLGNAIANMGPYAAGVSLIKNIYGMLKPGGRVFIQTVNRPEKLNYSPLREVDGNILQRIMVPYFGEGEHNVELHINIIDGLSYVKNEVQREFFMYSHQQFKQLVEEGGFTVVSRFGGYNLSEWSEDGAHDSIWILEKPNIEFTPETLRLFPNISPEELLEQYLKIWQQIYFKHDYRSVRTSRILHPRITTNPMYKDLKLENIRILDIGCALGMDMLQMISDGASHELVEGWDISEDMIEAAKIMHSSSNLQLFCKNAVLVQEVKELFSLIHTGSVIHLLSKEEVGTLIKNISGLLLPGGIFIGRTVLLKDDAPHNEINLLHVNSFLSMLKNSGFKETQTYIHKEDAHPLEGSYGTELTVSFITYKS